MFLRVNLTGIPHYCSLGCGGSEDVRRARLPWREAEAGSVAATCPKAISCRGSRPARLPDQAPRGPGRRNVSPSEQRTFPPLFPPSLKLWPWLRKYLLPRIDAWARPSSPRAGTRCPEWCEPMLTWGPRGCPVLRDAPRIVFLPGGAPCQTALVSGSRRDSNLPQVLRLQELPGVVSQDPGVP